MTPAVNRRTNKSRELFRVIVPDIKEEHDNYLVSLPDYKIEGSYKEIYLVRLGRIRSPVIFLLLSSL
jgi:hypothetical protein